ncbi:hypothetical protein ACIA5D_32685 [Actinoplanes sp. NPDC051513]|uniref:hypothetical protein n=1 Tax=Actinoplanes sp. NPDC051513 TaxID=3363908 RepID=UPI0037B765B9
MTIDPAKPTAVIVLGPQGTNIADSLPPFEVLAATGRFNVLLAATTPGPAPLAGGVDVVPHTTFEQLATLVTGGPDVVIVPQLKGDRARMKPVLDWLRKVHAGGHR